MNAKNGLGVLIFAIMFLVAGGVQAVPLLPAGDTPLFGTTYATSPQLGGVVLEDDLVGFSFTTAGGSISGTVQNRVVRSTLDGTLDFYWRIRDVESTLLNDFISSFRLGNFLPTIYDGDFRIDGLGDVGPDLARTFGAPGNVNFVFSNGLFAGQESLFFFLDTDATTYDRSAVYDFTSATNGYISGPYTTFAPTHSAPVPEPGTLLLTGLGLAGLVYIRRRKNL